MVQFIRLSLIAFVLGASPAGALAQSFGYSDGDYQYSEQQDGVAQPPEASIEGTEMRMHGSDVRSIPSVEPDDHADADISTPPPWPERKSNQATVAPGVQGVVRLVERNKLPEGTVVYAYPGYFEGSTRASGTKRVIYRTRAIVPQNSEYVGYEAGAPVPGGGRLVQFDPQIWLDECSRRIVPRMIEDEPTSRSKRHRSVGPVAENTSRQQCQTYLDDYMLSAQSGGLHGQYSDSGEYMLVPVTVLVPQRAVYRDGSPARQ